jgi:hypothetical protein
MLLLEESALQRTTRTRHFISDSGAVPAEPLPSEAIRSVTHLVLAPGGR